MEIAVHASKRVINKVKLMINRYISILSLSILVLLTSACQKDEVAPTDYDLNILKEVNNHRAAEGLTSLEHNEFIWQLAREHSLYMANNESNSNHDGIAERYEKLKDNFGSSAAGENVSSQYIKASESEIVNLWLASVSHKANIEGDYTITGISAVKSEAGTWYYTQIFYKQ